MPTPGEKKCIEGAEYVWTPASAVGDAQTISSKLSDIIDILNVIASKMGAGDAGSGISGSGYTSIEIDVDPNKNDWEITIPMPIRNINIRTDQPVKIRLGSMGGDQIKIDPTESPLELLSFGISVESVYVTTYDNQTNVKIVGW